MSTEAKYFDTGLASTALTSAATWAGTEVDPATYDTLCVPIKGAGINERIGRKISVKKIKIKGAITVAAQTVQAAADPGQAIRLVLYQDKQTNATQAQGEEVFAAPQIASAENATASFQSLNNFGRFRVLKDKIFNIGDLNITALPAGVAQSGARRNFKINYTFKKPITVHFNQTNGGTVADIVDNSFHILCRTTNAALAPAIFYEARCVYYDA